MAIVYVIPIILIIVLAALIVKIGAVALNLTGIDEKSAFFQALSAFTGTGFTTQDSELVVQDETRRRIISFLMITGNAGLVSVITTIILSLREGGPGFILGNIVVIVLAIIALIAVSKNKSLAAYFTKLIKRNLEKTQTFTRRPVEEIFRLAKDYGVAEVILEESCAEIGKTLAESSFRKQDILILAIERGTSVIPAPHAGDRLLANDTLICYGKLDNIAKIMGQPGDLSSQ